MPQMPKSVKRSLILKESAVHYYCCKNKVRCASVLSLWQVESLVLVPGRGQEHPLAALTVAETVYLLNPQDEEPRTLHSVYGHPVTCLDASNSHVALGVKRTGWAMHDGGNKVSSVSLHISCKIFNIKLQS